jgi:hypothetical protein
MGPGPALTGGAEVVWDVGGGAWDVLTALVGGFPVV